MSVSASDGYRAYISSPEWETVRQQRLEIDGRRCTGCGDDGTHSPLEVHHLTYERFGHERLTDLLTLCRLCHAREHGRAPNMGPVAGPNTGELAHRRAEHHRQEMLVHVLGAVRGCEEAFDALDVELRRLPKKHPAFNTARRLRAELNVLVRHVTAEPQEVS